MSPALHLKPCPFCGSADVHTIVNADLGGIKFFYCVCGAVVSFKLPSQKQADCAWNRRAAIADVERLPA